MPDKEFNWDDHPIVEPVKPGSHSLADAGSELGGWLYDSTHDPEPSDFNWDDHPIDRAHKSMLESGARGLHQGVTAGFQDELAGAGSVAGDWLFDLLHNKTEGEPESNYGDVYRKGRDEARQENAAAKEDNPWSYGGAEVLGSFAPTIATAGAGTEGKAGWEAAKQAMKIGAGQGGLMSAGGSEADLTKGNIEDFLKDVGTGTALGGVTGAAAEGISNAIPDDLADKVRGFAGRKAVKAMGGERGTMKKILGKTADTTNVENLGGNMMKHDLFDAFTGTEGMADRTQSLKDKSWQSMKDVFQSLDDEAAQGAINPYEGAKGLVSKNQILNDIQEQLGKNTDPRELESLMKQLHLNAPGDSLTMEEAQALKNSFNKTSNWENKLSPSDKNVASRDIESIIRDNIDSAVLKKSERLPELAAAREGYATGSEAQKLILNKQARELGNKTFGLTDYILAAPSIATHGATLPLVAAKKYGEKFGNQQMALIGKRLAQFIEANPNSQKYLDVLRQAAQRGAQPLASTMYVLNQQSPEFRDMQNEIEQNQ